MLIVETGQLANPRWVINFPTKRHWRGKQAGSKTSTPGLAALVAEHPPARHQVDRGCLRLDAGLGGLDWAAVSPSHRTSLRPRCLT